MKAFRVIAIISVFCLVSSLPGCIGRTQDEFINARRLEVYQDMSALRLAIEKYTATNKTLPPSVAALVPSLVSEDILNRPERRDLSGKHILVPARPYSMNTTSNGYEIICTFFGKGYTQVVMNIQGEVTVR